MWESAFVRDPLSGCVGLLGEERGKAATGLHGVPFDYLISPSCGGVEEIAANPAIQ